MVMQRLIPTLLTTAVLLLTACSGDSSDAVRGDLQSPEQQDTVYTEAAAMSIHRNNPERALQIIDSAVIVGNVTQVRAEYLKGVTQYAMANMPLARQTCLDLLSSISNGKILKYQSPDLEPGTDSATIQSVYMLLTSIEYTSGNYPAVVRYATEASRLAHDLDMPADAAKMEGYIAEAMAHTGRTDEGIDRLRTTIDELRQIDSFQGVVGYHATAKKLLHIMLENGRFDEMVPVCEAMLERINELGDHPENFSGIAEGFDPSEFVDFARGQTLVFLTTAYARQYAAAATPPTEVTPTMRAQLLRKAQQTEAAVHSTKWSRSKDFLRMITAAYPFMGEYERFDEAIEQLESTYPDTVNNNYYICLTLRSEAARLRGRTNDALSYLKRASTIRDSLDMHNQRVQLNELATDYHLQEEQLARQDAEADARFYRLLTWVIIAGLLAAIAFAIYFFYKRRETDKKNLVLAREIAESVKQQALAQPLAAERGVVTPSAEDATPAPQHPSTPASPSQASTEGGAAESADADLFVKIQDVILREQLFLNPQLDRQMLVERLGVSKERIGAAFAKGSQYKSLIDFLNDCRLPYAAKLLADQPGLSITDVAMASGFTNTNTFGRNFKQKYTLTPSQYREKLFPNP